MRTLDVAPATPPAVMREPMEPFCSECGSTNVHIAAWVSIRPDGIVEVEDYYEQAAGRVEDAFCTECDGIGTVEWRARKPEGVEA